MANKVILWGGVGEKNSNNNSQWYQQNRIYDADGIALCLSSAFAPWYVIKNEHKSNRIVEHKGDGDYQESI